MGVDSHRKGMFGQVSQTAYGLDWQRKAHPSASTAPIDDAQGHASNVRKSLSIGPDIYRGRVVDVIAYAQCYRVLLERNGGVLLCMALVPGSLLPVGPRPINSIGPGSEVYVLRPASGGYGIILGGFPSAMTAPELALSDFIHQSSRCGLRVDKTHSAAFACNDHGGIADWSDGRPFDGLSLGEWGAITETGLRVFLDPFMAQVAADEATGLFVFYHDQLLRLAGYNTQMFSGGHEVEIYVDQNEVHHYDGFTPYPWEQCGSLKPGVDPYQDIDPQAVQFDKPHYGAWEPQEDDQMPFHRSLQFRGYLGQGGKRMVQSPPGSGPNVYSQPGNYAGLFEENIGLDGRYSLRSSKAIHITKRIAIPAVKRMKRVENADGDNETNYKFSGVTGSGPDHKVTGEIKGADKNPHLQQAAGVMDVHAWVFNWLGAHPFHYHQQDWLLKEETDTFAKKVEAPISFGDLGDKFYLPRPDAVTQTVDHRYKDVSYFPNQSYLGMHDDGGVVIGDGYGAEIRMCGGHIFLTAPGDVWVKSGRNFNVLSGYDTCIRAHNSMDLSTTKHDLRLKAEQNLHLLGGNSGLNGGVLVECKAPSNYGYANAVGEDVKMGGFQVKVPQGDAVVWARNIYLRTGGGDVQPGIITIDAAAGQEVITFNASTISNCVSESIVDAFGADGNFGVTHIWSAQSNIIGSGICVQGFGNFASSVLVKGWLEVIGGHVGTELANEFNGYVGSLQGESLLIAYQSMQDCADSADKVRNEAQGFWMNLFTQNLYADKQPGNDDTIKAVHFTFRNPTQYRTLDFQLFEDRWQQLARLAGQNLPIWNELPVTGASSEDTMPYPGKAPWKDNNTYMQMDLSLYDPKTGASIPRTKTPAIPADKPGGPAAAVTEGKYEAPQFKDPQPKPPGQGYMVIV
jgi:hypothetical protein